MAAAHAQLVLEVRRLERAEQAGARPSRVRKYLIMCALSYNPHTNLHINKSREA